MITCSIKSIVLKSDIVLFLLLFFVVPPSSVSSAPAPPAFGVNHQTKECGEFFMGDECVFCRLPEGWMEIPGREKAACPEGYNKVRIRPVCFAAKNNFCCTKGHSGAPGNCQDLVIQEKEKKCAFVENIEKCRAIPEGWQTPSGSKLCPGFNYTWTDKLIACPDEFVLPMINGQRVDWCLTWGKDCGKAAADVFCQKQGYASSEDWKREYFAPTLVMGDGQTCNNKNCNAELG